MSYLNVILQTLFLVIHDGSGARSVQNISSEQVLCPRTCFDGNVSMIGRTLAASCGEVYGSESTRQQLSKGVVKNPREIPLKQQAEIDPIPGYINNLKFRSKKLENLDYLDYPYHSNAISF